MEENTTQTTPEECAVQENKCCCKKKLSGDLRTFIIALLTSVIVVLAYHGIRYSINRIQCNKAEFPCSKGFCAMQPAEKHMPHIKHRFPGKKFQKDHHFRKKEFKCSECGKKDFRHFNRKMKNVQQEQKQTAEQTAVE